MTLSEAVAYYETHEPRGEYVLVLEGGSETAQESTVALDPVLRVAYYIETGMNKKDAMRAAAKDCGLSRNELYQLLLQNESAQE